MNSKSKWIIICTSILLVSELFILMRHGKEIQYAFFSILLFLISFISGISFIYLANQEKVTKNPNHVRNTISKYIGIIIVLIGIGLLFYLTYSRVLHFPIDPKISDIIPAIQQQATRFVTGSTVYKPIQFNGYSYPLGYLPGVWLPFSIAELGNFDYRFIPSILFTVVLCGLLIFYRKDHAIHWIAISCLLFVLLFLKNNSGILQMTVELEIATYYLLFIYSLKTKNPYLQGAALGLCLLSRYTIALWVPLLLYTWIVDKQKKQLIRFIIVLAITIMAVYILPFFISNPKLIIDGFLSYRDAGLGEWQHFQSDLQMPFHLSQGIGFACFFYSIKSLTLIAKIKLMQYVLLSIISLSILVFAWYYYKKNKTINTPYYFLLGSIKIYFTLFFCFIHVPYLYLYTTVIVFNGLLVGEIISYLLCQKRLSRA